MYWPSISLIMRREAMAEVSLPRRTTDCMAGMARVMRMRMTDMTMSSSTSVKPDSGWRVWGFIDSSEERIVRSDFQIQSIDVWEDGGGAWAEAHSSLGRCFRGLKAPAPCGRTGECKSGKQVPSFARNDRQKGNGKDCADCSREALNKSRAFPRRLKPR